MDDYHFIQKSNNPKVIEVEDGVIIKIDADNNIIIEGQKSIKFKCEGDMDFDANTINMHAKAMNMCIDGDVYLGSSSHLVHQAPRIDLNPIVKYSGYYSDLKNKIFNNIEFDEHKSQFACEEINDIKLKGKFTVLIGKELHTYTDFDDIPERFDNVIEFLPDIPPPPHTPEQHEELGLLNRKLQELMSREQR